MKFNAINNIFLFTLSTVLLMNISGQHSDSEPISGFNTRNLQFVFRVVNTTGTGAMNTLPSFQNVTAKATLNRAGSNFELFNDNLQNLLLLSTYQKGLENWTLGSNMVQKGNGNAICGVCLQLPGPLNIASTDIVKLEVNVSPGTYNSASFNIPACSLDITWLPDDGIEKAIPGIKCYTIQTNSTQQKVSCGDNVRRVGIFNFDKGWTTSTPSTDAQQVINQITVASNEKTWTDLPDRLNMRVIQSFESQTEAIYRGQSYIFAANGKNLTNVILTINLNTANVNSGQNIVAWEYLTVDANTIQRSMQNASAQLANSMTQAVNVVGQAAATNLAQTQAQTMRAINNVSNNLTLPSVQTNSQQLMPLASALHVSP